MPAIVTAERRHTGRGSVTDLPPGGREDDDGGDSSWIRLTSAANDIDAHLVGGRLEAAGVQCRFVKETRDLAAWLYGGSNPWAPVNVMVRRFDLEPARRVLAEIALEDATAAREQGDRDD